MEKVFAYLEALGPNDQLNIRSLSLKLSTLFTLATLLRVSELAAISTRSLVVSPQAASFSLNRPRKAQHSGALRSFTLQPFESNANLCPVGCIAVYLDRTADLRPSNSDYLFVSLIRPHRAATATTLARWIKTILHLSGINTSIFGAHSVRGTASSDSVARGVPVEDVLRSGDWSSLSNFSRFYHRPISSLPVAPVSVPLGLGVTP